MQRLMGGTMRAADYIKDKAAVLLVHTAGLLFLSFFLKLAGNSSTDIWLIGTAWIVTGTVYLLQDFYRRRRYFEKLSVLLDDLDNRYLIAEVMEPSPRLEDRLYREVLRKSNKSVIEKIHMLEDAQKDYKEYIERWIHEVKLPLTAARLMCENNKREESRKLLAELGKIEKQIEQALFYARMEHPYQDYLIHRVNVRDAVLTSIAGSKPYFIQAGMQILLELPEKSPVFVCTDEKWVVFLLDQIFANCIKYRSAENPCVKIYAKEGKQQISLIIEDNGIGIAKEDIRRIFEKGFTGENGRIGKKSTGIGLYLCKGLCDKLGIGIACESKKGEFTRIIFTFPDSDFHVSCNLSKV